MRNHMGLYNQILGLPGTLAAINHMLDDNWNNDQTQQIHYNIIIYHML